MVTISTPTYAVALPEADDTPVRPTLNYRLPLPWWRGLARRAVNALVAERGEGEVPLAVIVRRMETLAGVTIPMTRHSTIGAVLGQLGLHRRLTTSRKSGHHRLVMLYTLRSV